MWSKECFENLIDWFIIPKISQLKIYTVKQALESLSVDAAT